MATIDGEDDSSMDSDMEEIPPPSKGPFKLGGLAAFPEQVFEMHKDAQCRAKG